MEESAALLAENRMGGGGWYRGDLDIYYSVRGSSGGGVENGGGSQGVWCGERL